MKTFLIKTLGCKVNSYESEFIRTIMLNDEYEEVNENADICIVNTCTVTNTADNKSKQVINNIRKKNSALQDSFFLFTYMLYSLSHYRGDMVVSEGIVYCFSVTAAFYKSCLF